MPTVNKPAELILSLNAGSSSLKFGLYRQGEDEEVVLSGMAHIKHDGSESLMIADPRGVNLHTEMFPKQSGTGILAALKNFIVDKGLPQPAAIAHRIVHGGPNLRRHQPITESVLAQLRESEHLAPLHIPAALELIDKVNSIYPGVMQFACFDTAFHVTMPALASRLPIPQEFADAGYHRYGFHGLSCESVMHRLGSARPQRIVIAHLGNGSSLTAVWNGRSVDTSMGLTPIGGIPMATRSGDLDPGVITHMMRRKGWTPDEIDDVLNHRCGVSALSGGEPDMQRLLAAAAEGNHEADFAIDVFCIAARKFIGGYAALMGGLDLIVFTGGIGQNSAEVRDRICRGLQFMYVDPVLKERGKVKVLEAQEEIQMARACRIWLNKYSIRL